jgi:integrase
MRAILPNISPVVADMILLQWHTGMRPGEVCIMRPVDIDTTGEVWHYRPSRHKCQYRGRERQVPLGPQAKEIVQRRLLGRAVDAFLFSPRESDQWRRLMLHSQRQTPMSCGNVPGSNRSESPLRTIGDRYTTNSYGRAVAYGCETTCPHPELSKIKPSELTAEQKDELRRWNADHRWTPNQLRHAAATRIRKVAGLEMARVVLGHSTIGVTEAYYAEADMQKASDLMKQIG